MPMTSPVSRRRCFAALALALVAGLSAGTLPALAQDPEPPPDTTTTTVSEPPTSDTVPTTEPEGATSTTSSSTTSSTVPPEDPGAVEELPEEPVPVVPATVPPRPVVPGVYAAQASQLIRQQLTVAKADAVELQTTYATVRDDVVRLETELDALEGSVMGLAGSERAAVARVEAARRRFEARTLSSVVRGRADDAANLVLTDDPNEIAVAQILLGSVLRADDAAVQEYLAAKGEVSGDLVRVAERLVDARLELDDARSRLVDARRAAVAAQFNLAVFAAGSEIVIRGFVFPVGDPHSFGDSFGAPRMMGTQYEHAHQGTDIMAPIGTPLLACERGIVTKMGSDVLGGTKLWLKGESGTYYYFAHLSAFEAGIVENAVVEAGDVVGYVGDTGNARGGAAHLHFEIHPDGGPAVNPYPLLKVVDDLSALAKAAQR